MLDLLPRAKARIRIWHLLACGAACGLAVAPASAQQVTATLEQDGPVTALALSPDGRLLAAGLKSGAIAVWELRTQRQLRSLPGSVGGITGLAFDGAGKRLASASGDEKALLWEPATGRQVRALSQFVIDSGTSEGFIAVAFTPDGHTVVLGEGGGRVTLWNIGSGAHQRMAGPHEAIVTGVAVTPDGSRVVSVDWTRRVRLRPLQPGREPESLGTVGDSRTAGLALAPDGVTLALGGSEKVYEKPQASYPITLWNLATRKMLSSLEPNPAPASALAFAKGGKVLASTGPDHVVRVWNTVTGKQLFETPGSVLASTDAGVLAVAEDKSVRLLRLPAGL